VALVVDDGGDGVAQTALMPKHMAIAHLEPIAPGIVAEMRRAERPVAVAVFKDPTRGVFADMRELVMLPPAGVA
jgi:hypothetical protein